jgi:hypothetical protein
MSDEMIKGDYEEETDELGVVGLGLSSIACEEHTDTGYRDGNAFTIHVVTVDGKPVERDTANAYYVMAEAAQRAGVQIRVVSGFRTMAEQRHLYECYTSCSCNNCNLAARPGYSNHQSGHALDLNTSAPGVLRWLDNNAGRFGFRRTVPGEAWHWERWGGGPGGGPCEDKARTVEWCNDHLGQAPDAYWTTLANAAESMPNVPDTWGQRDTANAQCMAKLACRYSEWRAGDEDGARAGMYQLHRDDFPYGDATFYLYRNGGADPAGLDHTARFWQSYAAYRHVLRHGYANPCEAWTAERQTGEW